MNKKRILALCCVLFLLVSAAGCSKAEGNETDTNAVYEALKKLEDCTSCTSLQITERAESVTEAGQTHVYNSTTEMEITLITDPAIKMRTKTRYLEEYNGQKINQSNVSYIVPENGGYSEYYFDGMQWYSVFVEDAAAMSDVLISDFPAMFVPEGLSFCKKKTETLESGNATLYNASLYGTDLVSFLYIRGYLSNIASMSENQQNKIKENLAKDLGELTVSVWVDEASGYPVHFELDMTSILSDMNKSISKTLGNKTSEAQWTGTKHTMYMDLWGFNSVEDLVLPPESANATPIDPSAFEQ